MYQALARSPILSVIAVTNPIITLSTNRIIVRTTATIRWIMGTNVVGPNDWISLYRTDVPDPAPLGTATAGVLASTSGHEWTYLFTVPGTYEARYVRANATNTVVPSIARSPILTVQEPVVDATLIRNYPSAGGNIIAVGDNLVRGTNATPDEDFVSELIRRLCCRAVLNKGVAGDTTSNVLARLQTDVLSQNPKIVIIMLGGDFLHGIPTSTTLGNLRNIIAQVHAAGAIVVLVGVQGGSFGTSFASSYQQLADESGCAYIPDVLRGIVGNSALMSTDVMPNNEGYEAIAKRVAPTVAVLDAAPAQPLAAAALPQQRMVELTWGQIIGTEYVLSAGTTATFADGAPILSIKRVGDTLVIGVRPSGQQGFFRLEPVLPPAESP
jgi:lysophospholipase L1-like esterase